jgi:hypothetical protein
MTGSASTSARSEVYYLRASDWRTGFSRAKIPRRGGATVASLGIFTIRIAFEQEMYDLFGITPTNHPGSAAARAPRLLARRLSPAKGRAGDFADDGDPFPSWR